MGDAVAGGGGLDSAVERLGRWTAHRSTRRGFLGRLGRGAVLVAGGPTMALLLAGQAEARVCGQSGVAPKCATFDCDAIWGWCWYASGCCADGALKKICDCCAPNTPHPVGYCPSGTRVKCIVESCGADPRLQTRTISRWRETGPVDLALAASRIRFPDGAAMAVLGDSESAEAAGVAASLGRVVDGPVLLCPRAELPPVVLEELVRLGVEHVRVVGGDTDPAVDQALAAQGMSSERLSEAADLGGLSADVAVWSRTMTGARTAVVVAPSAGAAGVGPAAALAHAKGWPLLVGDPSEAHRGLTEPREVQRTYVLTAHESDARRYPAGMAVVGATPEELAARTAEIAVGREGVARSVVALSPAGDHRAAAAMATWAAPVVQYAPGSLDGARDWLFAHRPGISAALVAGTVEEFGDEPYYELQSLLNEYETHLLRGGAGEGLPVITQPRDERPIGEARWR